jgi:hypothetical protein
MKPSSLYVRFFVRMDGVLKNLGSCKPSMSETDRKSNQRNCKIEKEITEEEKVYCFCSSIFQGNEYYYFVYQDYKTFVGWNSIESLGKW